MPSAPASQSTNALPEITRAKATLDRKKVKTPLEDLLTAKDDDARALSLVRWAKNQRDEYLAQLTDWRQNRVKWLQEAQDSFQHRKLDEDRDWEARRDKTSVFKTSNDSMNVVGAIAEFAAASAENDLFGAEPWFATVPMGRTDPKLADDLQKHLRWTLRDGVMVDHFCQVIDHAAICGETFVKTSYQIETDEHEAAALVLHAGSKPLVDDKGQYIDSEEAAAAFAATPAGKKRLKGKELDWKQAFRKVQTVIRQGVQQTIIHPNDIAFRETAPELDLQHTNVYVRVEMSVMEAMRRFRLSREDALKLAQMAQAQIKDTEREQTKDSQTVPADTTLQTELGAGDAERLLNSRIELVEGYVLADPIGDGRQRRCYIVFVAAAEDWLIYADYLANVSPKAELPVKCHVWERAKYRLYGRGFFSKYSTVQRFLDSTWNAVKTRNEFHANPVTGFHRDCLVMDELEDFTLNPGESKELKKDKSLSDAFEFAKLPDADNRSMELFSTAIQLMQLRSGVSSASQGDVAGVPEANTATGIRQLMSRSAVILKRPINSLKRTISREFAFSTKLIYSNFDRDEAFVFGEGENAELVSITADQVKDLEMDVRLLLTQQQNQMKMEGTTTATNLFDAWLAVPEAEKGAARPLYMQGIKALEFSGAEEIIRPPNAQIEDCNSVLPPDQQARLQQLLLLEQQVAANSPTTATTPAP